MAARAALASSLSRLSSRPPAANLTTRRGLAAGGDHHGPPRINIWEDPMSPSKWKEEHFVLASLSGWGLLIYGGLKAFGGKKEKKEEASGRVPVFDAFDCQVKAPDAMFALHTDYFVAPHDIIFTNLLNVIAAPAH